MAKQMNLDRKTFSQKVYHQLYRQLCRSLCLPQRAAQDLAYDYCQTFWLEVHQNWEDGYSVDVTVEYLNMLIAASDSDIQTAA